VVEAEFLEAQNQGWHEFGRKKVLPGARISFNYGEAPTVPEKKDLISTAVDLAVVAKQLTHNERSHVNSIAASFGIKNYANFLLSGSIYNPSYKRKQELDLNEDSESAVLSQNDVVIEFTGEQPVQDKDNDQKSPIISKHSPITKKPKPVKKLTPLEAMQEKVRRGLNQSSQLSLNILH